MSGKTLISLITSTLNCAQDLELTMQSVREQQGSKIDWIIADGASTDETLEVIQQNADIVSTYFSEKDSGIYDAWNKAIHHVRGEWVLFFGAGDTFCHSDTLAKIEKILRTVPDEVGLIYGNVIQKLNQTQEYFYGEVDLNSLEDNCKPRLPAHQGVLVRKRLFIGQEPFDSSYKILADGKFLFLTLKRCKALYINVDICNMLPGGVSSSPQCTSICAKEVIRLQKDLGYKLPWIGKNKFIIKSRIKYGLWKLLGKYYFHLHRIFNKTRKINSNH